MMVGLEARLAKRNPQRKMWEGLSKVKTNSNRSIFPLRDRLKKESLGTRLTWLHRVEPEGTGGGYLEAIGKAHGWLSGVGHVSSVDGADSEIGRVVDQTTVFNPRQEM